MRNGYRFQGESISADDHPAKLSTRFDERRAGVPRIEHPLRSHSIARRNGSRPIEQARGVDQLIGINRWRRRIGPPWRARELLLEQRRDAAVDQHEVLQHFGD
jgi:hypothetical protein